MQKWNLCYIKAQFTALWLALVPEPDTWHLFFDASSSMFGVRLWAEEILRIEWRCSSVRQLLCDVLFNFITEKSCSHRYVLPNIESIWATWARSWGIVSGMKRGNCAAPTESYFDLCVSLHWSSISSIWRLVGALSTSTANGLLSSSNLLYWASKSANRRVKSTQVVKSHKSALVVMSHRNAHSHQNPWSRSSVVSFPLLYMNWNISSRKARLLGYFRW